MNKTALRFIGFILIIIGIFFIITGIYNMLFSSISMGATSGIGIFKIFFGGVFIIIGSFMLYISYIGKIVSYATKEAAPGVERISRAVGKGFSKGYRKKKK